MINYFDLGLHLGYELEEMITHIFPSLNFENYKCYGFEASKQFADINEDMYRRNDDVIIIQKAISDTHNGTTKLYYMDPEIQPGQVGMSIFETKTAASESHEEVETIKFSEWLAENVPSYKEDYNILKVNIEGAEYHLFKDMVDSDILKYFPTIVGAGHDVEKVAELDSNEYWKLIKDNNIILKRYCSNHKPERNVDIISLILFDHQSYLANTSL